MVRLQHASRAATLKLLLVVLAFIVPLSWLALQYWMAFRIKIADLDRRVAAIQLVSAIHPMHLEKDGKLHALSETIADSLGFLSEFRAAATGSPAELSGFVEKVSLNEALLSSGSVEDQLLARVIASDSLRLDRDISLLFDSVKTVSSVSPLSPAAALATALKSLDPLVANVRLATLDDDFDDQQSDLVDVMAGFERTFRGLGQLVERAPALERDDVLRASLTTALHKDLVVQLGQVTTLAARKLTTSQDNEAKRLENNIYFTLAAVIGSAVLGLILALSLFGSTLRKLDRLQTSHAESERSRGDADQMNQRLTEINADIVSLNHELADKMRRLKEAQDELVKKGQMEQLGQLTATVAHELRNPLGAVRTSAFLLERRIKGKGLGVETQIARINSGVSRCDNIITQLLDFSRTRQIAAAEADLDGWLARLIEEEAKRLPTMVSISCNLGLRGLPVPFDPARLERAIINLVNNASEAMVGAGDDNSKIATENPIITIATMRERDGIVIAISDNGPGIPPLLLEKVREPLFTTKSFGTGLGLPAVEQIVVQHGGRFDIQSPPGAGAQFHIWLPLHAPKEEAA